MTIHVDLWPGTSMTIPMPVINATCLWPHIAYDQAHQWPHVPVVTHQWPHTCLGPHINDQACLWPCTSMTTRACDQEPQWSHTCPWPHINNHMWLTRHINDHSCLWPCLWPVTPFMPMTRNINDCLWPDTSTTTHVPVTRQGNDHTDACYQAHTCLWPDHCPHAYEQAPHWPHACDRTLLPPHMPVTTHQCPHTCMWPGASTTSCMSAASSHADQRPARRLSHTASRTLFCWKTLRQRPFSFMIPTVWNSLHTDMHSKKSTPMFRQALETHLFKSCILIQQNSQLPLHSHSCHYAFYKFSLHVPIFCYAILFSCLFYCHLSHPFWG